MARQKTHKALRKRIRITGRKKLIRRRSGQDHFNARESGKTKKNKRRDVPVSKTLRRAIRKSIPYR